jgi:Tol biopolymer transport system component
VSYLVAQGAGNAGDVWRQPADGSGRAERVITSSRLLAEQIAVPGTGAMVVRTTSATPGSGDILTMRPGVDSAPVPLIASRNAEYTPSLSPDGKWMAYASDESGRFEVYVTLFASPSDAEWVVSTNGGITPRWSHSGDELFYQDLRSNIMVAQVTRSPSFAVLNTRVLFNAADYIQVGLSRRNFDVSADGQRFLMVQRADAAKRGQMIVIEHWLDEMKRTARQ